MHLTMQSLCRPRACLPFCCLLLSLFISLNPAFASDEPKAGATVLIYHKFGEDQYPTTNVGAERFKEQMAFLKENGYQVISLDMLADTLNGHAPLPENAVVITIDDGYLSTYTEAWPVLKKYGYPFTVFIYVKAVDSNYRNFVTWEQLREMKSAGVDIEDHSFSHNRMGSRPKGLSDKEYRSLLRDDLIKSRAIMQKELGEQPRFFAIPYGEYNSHVIDVAKKLGYKAILTQDPGSVSSDTDKYMIPREPILGNEWSSMNHFKKVLERVDLPIVDFSPTIEPFRQLSPSQFKAQLKYPERYVPGTLGIYVSELGWKQAEQNGEYVSIKNSATLSRRLNRVMVSGKEKETGKTAIFTWMLLQEIQADD